LDKELLRESIKELTAIMSSKWKDEGELSSEEIQIYAPFYLSIVKYKGTRWVCCTIQL
jgi:hypothetical protein